MNVERQSIGYSKDGFHDCVIQGDAAAVNQEYRSIKVAYLARAVPSCGVIQLRPAPSKRVWETRRHWSKERLMRNPLASTVVILLACMALAVSGGVAMGVGEAPYTVEKRDGAFEVRLYAPQIVAETIVDGTMEEAGNKAFRPLFNYISGGNRARGKIAMTAPVGQQSEGQKIAMTAPVGQESVSNQWSVTFTMPTNFTLSNLPLPTDDRVRLRPIPGRRMATVRYSGTWSRERYERNLSSLREWMKTNGLFAAGAPVWARYNSPFTLWFLRRNEILIPIKATQKEYGAAM